MASVTARAADRRLPFLSSRPAFLQLFSVAGIVLGLVALVVTSADVVEPLWVWAGVCLVVAMEVIAIVVPWHRATGAVVAVPVLAIVGFGLFRAGTQDTNILFAALVLLPLLWLGVLRTRLAAPLGAVAVAVAYMLPAVVGVASWDVGIVVEAVLAGVVYGVIVGAIRIVANDARARLDEVRAAEATTRSLWGALTSDAVIATDLDGRIVEWGPGATALLGDRGDPPTGGIADVVVPESLRVADASAALAALIEVGKTPGRGDGDVEFVATLGEGGERIPVLVSWAPWRDAGGAAIGHIFVARDARYAKEIEQLKDQFVGNVSHELRTPLGSILGYLELVRMEPLTPDQEEYVAVAERNAKRLLGLVGDLLLIAQVEGGRFPLEVGEADLSAIAAASVESIRPVAERAGVEIAASGRDGVVVPGDPARLAQALDNLLSNAVKFTPSGGRVTVTVAVTGVEALVSVADTGVGIAPDDLARLSERFFRARTATRQAVPGVGLGLAITKAIAEAHGGTLSASSVLGEGTTFEIRFPLH